MGKEIREITYAEAIRLRPSMYVGGTNSRALHTMLLSMIKEFIELAADRRCTAIDVTLHGNNQIVLQAISYGDSLFERSLFSGSIERIVSDNSVGTRISMATFANMLSSEFAAEMRRNGIVCVQQFQAGNPLGSEKQVRLLESGEASGVTFSFTPDSAIFDDDAEFNHVDICVRLREFAYLAPGVRITLRDERQSTLSSVQNSISRAV